MVNVKAFPLKSLKVSLTTIPFKAVLPVFSTVIRNVIVSPRPVVPFPLSTIVAVLVTSIEDCGVTVVSIVIVASFGVLVLGSSLVSETVPPFVPCAVTVAVLDTPPAFIA